MIDWNSPEADAWSRDFDYEDYHRLVMGHHPNRAPVSIEEYTDLRVLYNRHMYGQTSARIMIKVVDEMVRV